MIAFPCKNRAVSPAGGLLMAQVIKQQARGFFWWGFCALSFSTLGLSDVFKRNEPREWDKGAYWLRHFKFCQGINMFAS